jgi:hypothetical protein
LQQLFTACNAANDAPIRRSITLQLGDTMAARGVPKASNRLFFGIEIFFQVRFGAIWCDWVLLATRCSILLRQGYGGQGFKVQPGTGRGKNCRFGPPSGPIKPCWKPVFTFIGFD